MNALNRFEHLDQIFVDPVCGMSVQKNSLFHMHHGNETYYFCSEHCLHRFRSYPQAFVGDQSRQQTVSLSAVDVKPSAEHASSEAICSHCTEGTATGPEYI